MPNSPTWSNLAGWPKSGGARTDLAKSVRLALRAKCRPGRGLNAEFKGFCQTAAPCALRDILRQRGCAKLPCADVGRLTSAPSKRSNTGDFGPIRVLDVFGCLAKSARLRLPRLLTRVRRVWSMARSGGRGVFEGGSNPGMHGIHVYVLRRRAGGGSAAGGSAGILAWGIMRVTASLRAFTTTSFMSGATCSTRASTSGFP